MSRNTFEVYAVKYATREGRRPENFHGGDPHDAPMTMDYYVWVLVSPDLTVVVDTGFTPEVAKRRGRTHLRCPAEALASLGIEVSTVPLVILTHLHYDHIGNLDMFPKATFMVQEEEMAFWTGRYASRGHFRCHVEVEDVVWLARQNFGGRLRFVSGSERIAPGVTVHRVGGHSAGLQIVEVETARGAVVVASDACHFYENVEDDRPFSIVTDVPEMYGAFDVVNALAETSDRVVPGHDPLVMERFESVLGLEGIAVRIA
jgi:glyoxylase-like metal-dependent hydrolase (beta-lactamase superfamily II)